MEACAIKRVAKRTAIKFLQGNAENTSIPVELFDHVNFMLAFHETPLQDRNGIFKEARRLLPPVEYMRLLISSLNMHHRKINAVFRSGIDNHLRM